MERGGSRPWYFLHIPKTAGTTFRVLLENRFHMDEICPAYEFFQIKLYSDEQLRRFRLFRGHMGYNLINYLPEKPHTLVMLRDPMERAVSHFEYICRDPAHPKHRIIQERGLKLKEYLLDPMHSAEVTNAQVRPLAHTADQSLLQTLLAGSASQDEFALAWRHASGALPADDELLDIALQRLEKMTFVGVAEELDRGMQLAAWLLGAPAPSRVQSLNINPGRTPVDALPADTLDLLERATALDRQLYARARELFEKQYQQMFDAPFKAKDFACDGFTEQEGERLIVDFIQPLCGSGWHQRELVPGKGVLRWTGPGTEAEIQVPLDAALSYDLQITIADKASEEVLRSLVVMVNGVEVPVTLSGNEQGMRARAAIDASVLRAELSPARIGLRVSHTQALSAVETAGIDHSHARKVGIAVYRFEFSPK